MGSGTTLDKGIDLAAKEITRHGKKTTVIVLTDGEDNTLGPMIANRDRITEAFGNTEFVINSTTPRLFDMKGSPQPQNPQETQLKLFSEAFHGRFGPNRGGP
jgi:hypothetical protein